MGTQPNKSISNDVHGAGDVVGDSDRVLEWEASLPAMEDLTPLHQPLISPELAAAFRISPEPYRTVSDVNRASEEFVSSLTRGSSGGFSCSETDPNGVGSSSDPKKMRKVECSGVEEADSGVNDVENSGKTTKRPRLVWTPQLHKRFVDVVAHLGIKNAVPKTIMQMMNVEGLTRENVASHLQKYRLYLKRMHGEGSELGSRSGSGSGDGMFTELIGSGNGNRNGNVPMPLPMYGGPGPGMVPMPVYGMPNGHMGLPMGNSNGTGGFEYGMMQPMDWNGYRNGLVGPYPSRVAYNDNK